MTYPNFDVFNELTKYEPKTHVNRTHNAHIKMKYTYKYFNSDIVKHNNIVNSHES